MLFLAGSHLILEAVPASVREYACMSLAQLDLNVGWKRLKYEFYLGITSLSWETEYNNVIVSLCWFYQSMFNLVIEEFLTACLCDTATECKDTNFLKHVGKIFCL